MLNNETTINAHRAEAERIQAESTVALSLERAGLSRENVPKDILNRLVLLELHTHFNQHARRMEQGIRNLAKLVGITSEGELQTTCLGALVHDIGKTGPSHASPEKQHVIVNLFSYPINTPTKTTLKEALMQNEASSNLKEIGNVLQQFGLSVDSTMRDLYDIHALWTENILKVQPGIFSEQMRVMATSHHLDRGIDPCGIASQIAEQEESGAKDPLGITGRLLLAIDKYEAAITREERTHSEAMDVVKQMLNERFHDDVLMARVVKAIDELGSKGTIFQ